MKTNMIILLFVVLILGCSQQPKTLIEELPHTYLKPTAFNELPDLYKNNFTAVVDNFIYNCQSSKTKKLYGYLCHQAQETKNAKEFILQNFQVYRIYTKNYQSEGLLTGYFEPEIEASLKKDAEYKYPLYNTPKDLIAVDLSIIYPELKNYRLRGKLQENKLVPYYTRAEIKRNGIESSVICYCKSKIDRYFLEVQGSGKIVLDDNSTFYVGYDNQNGYKYTSIGKYLINKGEIAAKNISLESIRSWLEAHPQRVDEVLNKNKAMVFFSKRSRAATGALGLELRAKSSVAVDSKYIPLGSMLYLSSNFNTQKIDKFVFAQDIGGAIKGAIRADYFLGSGDEALKTASSLKAPLHLWIILPKKRFINE